MFSESFIFNGRLFVLITNMPSDTMNPKPMRATYYCDESETSASRYSAARAAVLAAGGKMMRRVDGVEVI